MRNYIARNVIQIGKIREYYLRVLTDYRRSPGETNKAIISSLSIRNSMANGMCSTAFPIPFLRVPFPFFILNLVRGAILFRLIRDCPRRD